MHPLRRNILRKLSSVKSARFSDLKDKGIENNLFTYHMKMLSKDGYILHKGTQYSLTPKGKHLVDRMSSTNFIERIQPKIITITVLKKGSNKNPQYLLCQRKKQPFFDQIGFPNGKIHLDERICEAALRELQEKTGLQAKLRYRGHLYVTIHNETELVSSMLCHVFTGTQITGKLFNENKENKFSDSSCFWGRIEDVSRNALIPGTIQIERLVQKKQKGLFFEEYFLNTSD